MADALGWLRQTRNDLIGNPTAKLHFLHSKDVVLATIVGYTLSPFTDSDYDEETTLSIRLEAANIIASLSRGPREVLDALISACAPRTVVSALNDAISNHSNNRNLKLATTRALRALFGSIAEYVDAPLWGLGEEYLEMRSKARTELDYLFQPGPLDIVLPLLEDDSPQIRLAIAELLYQATRVAKHRSAVTDWLPYEARQKEHRPKRGWEVTGLVNANSPSRGGGWVIRQLTSMLRGKDFKAHEMALYAISVLARDNPATAILLTKSPPDNKGFFPIPSVLSTVTTFISARNIQIRLAACFCATSIIRSIPQDRNLSTTVIQMLNSVIEDVSESTQRKSKAAFILSKLLNEDHERCTRAKGCETLQKTATLIKEITPTEKPQEWEDGEPIDAIRLREAAFTLLASLASSDNENRVKITDSFGLLPYISVCFSHPDAGIRYAACQCARVLSRDVRVLRTSLLDCGIGSILCDIVEKHDEDRRVTNAALAALCNLINEFSPLKKTILDRGLLPRITELSASNEPEIKRNALWALKNLLNKSTNTEKLLVMNHLTWDRLKDYMQDPKDTIREQALNIARNIASNEQSIDIIFLNIIPGELMNIIAESLESPTEDIAGQAMFLLANLSNGSSLQRRHVLSNSRVLKCLKAAMTHKQVDIRRAAVSCVEQLAKSRAAELRELDFDTALRNICRDVPVIGGSVFPALSASPSSNVPGSVSAASSKDRDQDIRESARSALRHLDSHDDFVM